MIRIVDGHYIVANFAYFWAYFVDPELLIDAQTIGTKPSTQYTRRGEVEYRDVTPNKGKIP